VTTAANGDEAKAIATVLQPDLAVVDLRMPGMDGLSVLQELLAIRSTTRVLVLTGYGSIATAVKAIKLGAVNYLPKPVNADEILAVFAGREGTSLLDSKTGSETPSLDRVEWEHIQRILEECGGNVSETARQLGIPRRTLQRKLRKRPD
jgi:two-component system response regulator RegA